MDIDIRFLSRHAPVFQLFDRDDFAGDRADHMIARHQDLKIAVDMGLGSGQATVWTCDLTKRYIEINADYRS